MAIRFEHSCPYYGCDEDRCEVGFGYISPHDVEVIVRHCISNFRDCDRYAQIRARERTWEEQLERRLVGGGEEPGPGRAPLPFSLDQEALTTIHHELRTPLTSIRSFTEILLQYPVQDLDAKRQFLRIIRDEAERLGRTVDAWFGTTGEGDGANGGATDASRVAAPTRKPSQQS